jgi:hypothetical protein
VPYPFSAGEILTAANLNDSLGVSASWVPTWTNLTVGNGTVSAREASFGPFQFFYIQLVWGSTTSISGAVSLASVPVNVFNSSNAEILSQVKCTDTSATATYSGHLNVASASTMNVRKMADSGIAGNPTQEAAITATAPFTWTTADVLQIAALYFTA